MPLGQPDQVSLLQRHCKCSCSYNCRSNQGLTSSMHSFISFISPIHPSYLPWGGCPGTKECSVSGPVWCLRSGKLGKHARHNQASKLTAWHAVHSWGLHFQSLQDFCTAS
jgi:hypothetical protein